MQSSSWTGHPWPRQIAQQKHDLELYSLNNELGSLSKLRDRCLHPVVRVLLLRLRLWELQVELAKDFQRGVALFQSSIASLSNLLDQEAQSLTLSNPAECMLLVASSSKEETECVESSPSVSPTYGELLDVMAHSMVILDLSWKNQEFFRSRLDE